MKAKNEKILWDKHKKHCQRHNEPRVSLILSGITQIIFLTEIYFDIILAEREERRRYINFVAIKKAKTNVFHFNVQTSLPPRLLLFR